MHQLKCMEIWGGIRNEDQDVASGGLAASLFSAACDGGKGGDIYYFSVCGGDQLTRVAVADVVGHGSAVASVGEYMYDAMVANIQNPEGSAVLEAMNHAAVDKGMDAMTTVAVITFYIADHHLRFAYAGHHPALVRRVADGTWTEAHAPDPRTADPDGSHSGLPLAIAPDTRYHQHETPLAAGDRIVLYTDGVIEAPDPAGEQFGLPRLRDALHAAGDAPLSELKSQTLTALRTHTGGPLTHDDVTLVALEVR